MRASRIKEPGHGYYHVISRVVDRRMVMDRHEKERFRALMRNMEAFSGCEVLTYALLDNHFHILLRVPDPRPVSDDQFVQRLGHLYDRQVVERLDEQLKQLRQEGRQQAAEKLKGEYTYRMHDLSEFVKTLKQRFTQSYNRRHGRKGTLWEERFKSVLIGGSEHALVTVAAYIDLNAVRAGIVEDPKEYRFCGYGEAVGGSQRARHGLSQLWQSLEQARDWPQLAREYRKRLYQTGETTGVSETRQRTRRGFEPEEVAEVLASDGALPLCERLRCRTRYFTDGAVLGTEAFVAEVFHRHREMFSPNRVRIAHKMPGQGWGGLCTLRRLRLNVTGPPPLAG